MPLPAKLLILPLGIALVRRLLPAVVLAEARVQAAGAEKPRHWAGALIVVSLWAAIAWLAYRWLRGEAGAGAGLRPGCLRWNYLTIRRPVTFSRLAAIMEIAEQGED